MYAALTASATRDVDIWTSTSGYVRIITMVLLVAYDGRSARRDDALARVSCAASTPSARRAARTLRVHDVARLRCGDPCGARRYNRVSADESRL